MDSINTHKIHANKICPPSPTPPTPPPTEKPPTKKPFVKCGLVTAFDEQFVHQTYEKLKKLSGNITKKTKEEMIECFEINLKCFKSIKQLQNLQKYHHNQAQINNGKVEIEIEYPFIDGQIFTLKNSFWK